MVCFSLYLKSTPLCGWDCIQSIFTSLGESSLAIIKNKPRSEVIRSSSEEAKLSCFEQPLSLALESLYAAIQQFLTLFISTKSDPSLTHNSVLWSLNIIAAMSKYNIRTNQPIVNLRQFHFQLRLPRSFLHPDWLKSYIAHIWSWLSDFQ